MIKVGMLGSGGIGAVHGDAYKRVRNARVVAVADCIPEVADRLASELQAQAYYSIDALLEDREVEMVDVCLPTPIHADAVVAAARAGKHILCEKPIARNLDEADRMIRAVRQAGVKAMIAQVVRFWPQYALIKETLVRGDIGAPLAATATRLVAHGRLGMGWHFTPELGDGAILDLHIHDLDYIYYLLGKPQRVYAAGVKSPSGTYDHVVTSLDYGRFIATAEASFRLPAGFPVTFAFRLVGEKGCVDYRFSGAWHGSEGGQQDDLAVFLAGQPPQHPSYSQVDAFAAEIEYFAECIMTGREPDMASLADARAVLEVNVAARRSAATGQVVELERAGDDAAAIAATNEGGSS